MHNIRKWWIGGAAGVMLAAVVGVGAVMAQTPSSTPSTSNTPAATATAQPQGNDATPQQAPGNGAAPSGHNCPHMGMMGNGNAPSPSGGSPSPASPNASPQAGT